MRQMSQPPAPRAIGRLRRMATTFAPSTARPAPGHCTLEQQAPETEALFHEAVIERQFDRTRWERDGYAVFEGVMTDRAVCRTGLHLPPSPLISPYRPSDSHSRGEQRDEWAAALRRVLAANDAFIMSDWDRAGLDPELTGYLLL